MKKLYYLLKYGFDIRDTWSLDYSMCKWLLPRLKMFKKENIGFPVCKDLNKHNMTWEMWNYYLSLMIYWCERVAKDEEPIYKKKISKEMKKAFPDTAKEWTSEENRIARRTFDLGEKCFHKYFNCLWW